MSRALRWRLRVEMTTVQTDGDIRPLPHRFPIAAFVVLTLVWSWGVWSLLFLFGGRGVLLEDPPTLAFVIAGIGGLGPTLSGLLLTRWIYGREGMRALGSRLHPHTARRWWPAVLIIPAATAVTPLFRSLAGYPQDGGALLALLGPGLALGLGAGLMEEFGWRGFLLPHLLEKHSPLVSTLLLGLVWGGLWHGYADFFGVARDGWTFGLLIVLLGPGLLTAWSLILTRVHERTGGSLLMSILMHASISSSALILGQKYASGEEELLWTATSVAVAWVAAGATWRALRPPTRPAGVRR